MNRILVSLAKYPDLGWVARQAVLVAEAEQESLRLYEMDLLWMLVRAKYNGDFPQPSKLVKRGYKEKGPETAEEIKNYIISKLDALITKGVEP